MIGPIQAMRDLKFIQDLAGEVHAIEWEVHCSDNLECNCGLGNRTCTPRACLAVETKIQEALVRRRDKLFMKGGSR